MNDNSSPQVPAGKSGNVFSLSWRALAVLLLAVIGLMLYLWMPWEYAAPKRTITVQGEASISAVPDTYSFQPVYQNADVKVVTTQCNEAVAQLKKLGIKDADIKTNIQAAGSADTKPLANSTIYPPVPSRSGSTCIMTVTAHDKTAAQKAGDYLATTSATGQVTPAATFSQATQSKLDLEARSQASSDAKQKAEVMAKQLGAHVGRVVTISEGGGYGIYAAEDSVSSGASPQTAKAAGPTIQPGTDEVSYSFTVVFELK